LKTTLFLPNSNISFIFTKLLTKPGEEHAPVLHSSVYETRKPYVNSKKTIEYKYPLIGSK